MVWHYLIKLILHFFSSVSTIETVTRVPGDIYENVHGLVIGNRAKL